MLVIVPFLVSTRGRLSEVAERSTFPSNSSGATSTCCSCPASAVRTRRPNRGGHRRGRSHLDLDGRALRPSVAAHPERGDRALPPGDRVARDAGLPEAPALALGDGQAAGALGPETLGDAGGIETADPGRRSRPWSRTEARLGARALRVDYFAHSTGEWSSRVIDPERSSSSSATGTSRRGTWRRRGALVPRRSIRAGGR